MIQSKLIVVLRRTVNVRIITRTNAKLRTVTLFNRRQPSMILVSLGVPGVKNMRTVTAVHRARPSIHVVVLAACSNSRSVFHNLDTKTQNCLLGGMAHRTLVRTVRHIRTKRACVPVRINTHLTRHVNDPRLAPQRQSILLLLARNGSGRRVTTTLMIDRNAMGFRIGNVLEGLGIYSHARTILITLGHNVTGL